MLLLWSGVWNYQISLLDPGQVDGQNQIVQLSFTCPKIDIFLIPRYVVGTH